MTYINANAGSARIAFNEQFYHKLVEAALLAPTGDNCQPFVFVKKGDEVFIYHVSTRGDHFYNPQNLASWLSLGCVIEAMRVAAGSENFLLFHELLTDKMQDDQALARVWLGSSQTLTGCGVDSLASRYTERRVFQRGKLSELERQELLGQNHDKNVQLRLLDVFPKSLVDFICEADGVTWRHERAHTDLFRWIRFSKQQYFRTRDGMPADSLGLDPFQTALFRLCKPFWMQNIFNKLGFIFFTKQHIKRLVKSSAALVCVSVNDHSPKALVTAGSLGMRAWLYLTEKGYAVQPLSVPAMFAYATEADILPPELSSREVELFSAGRNVLKESFKCGLDESPVWLFRTGSVRQGRGITRSLRLPAEAVIR